MNNSDILRIIFENLKENDELKQIINEVELSYKDKKLIEEILMNKAAFLDNMGVLITYEEWEFILIEIIDKVAYTSYYKGKVKPRPRSDIELIIENTIMKSSSVDIPNFNIDYIDGDINNNYSHNMP